MAQQKQMCVGCGIEILRCNYGSEIRNCHINKSILSYFQAYFDSGTRVENLHCRSRRWVETSISLEMHKQQKLYQPDALGRVDTSYFRAQCININVRI